MGLAIFGILITLLQLAVVAGIVVLIVRAVKKRDDGEDRESLGTAVRRLFQYVLLFGALMAAAAGVIGLLGAALETGEIARDAADLAVPLSLTIVGVPVFAGLALWTRRNLASDRGEQRSVAWALYLGAVLVVALIGSIVQISATLIWLVGGDSGGPDDLAGAVVWVAMWASHWWIGRRRPPIDDLRTQRLAGSAISLWVMAGFGIALAATAATWLYDEAFRTTLATTIGDDLRTLAPPLAVGAVVWAWYWLGHAVRDERTGLWHAYVLLAGVLLGLMTALTAAGIVVFAVLEWVFGSPEDAAADHFAVVPASLVAGLVGLAVLLYHRRLIHRRHDVARIEIDRVYDYLVAAVGLVASATALTVLISAAIEAVAPAPVAERGSTGVDTLLLAITLFLVGGPLWWFFWSRVQGHAAGEPEETHSVSRRLYLFSSFGVGGIVAVISFIVALATALGDLLDGEIGGDTLFDVRVPVALVVTVGAVAAFHWTVFREDRSRAPEPERRRTRRVLVVGAGTPDLHRALADATGARPQVWQRVDGPNPAVEAAEVMDRVDAVDADLVMVIVHPDGGLEVFPVEAVD